MKTTGANPSIPTLLVHLWHHLKGRRKRQLVLLMGLMLISAFVEVVSLGAVLPFLGILTSPDLVLGHPLMADVVQFWGIISADKLVLPLTVVFVIAAIVAGTTRIFLLWVSTRVAFAIGADLGIEVYRRTLYQPYCVHLARNSSNIISGITNKVNGVVFGVLLPCLSLLSSIILLIAIIIALVVINPIVASAAALGFSSSYALITLISRRRLQLNSRRIAHEQSQVVKALQEGLGSIRDVLLDGTQSVYCNIYRLADRPLRRAQGNNAFIGGSPRYAMEALGMVLIASLAFFLSRQVGGIATALPVLGALALGAQRLLPALQQSYSAWSSIAGSHASFADAIALLSQPLPAEVLMPAPPPLLVKEEIRFEDVRFRYTDSGPWVLDGVNLAIPKGARVGIVGKTGSGKSTAMDALMALILPTEGAICVDKLAIVGPRIRAWQASIGHVPQSIYLADTTLAENIAFGVPPDLIDLNRVRRAARQAQIADFIESKPEGYRARVGEHGVRLSGGQRQRIGIARALYKQVTVLVFDEATSALDSETEKLVMDSIEGLSSDLTIFHIAHRLTTLRNCDVIVELENGRVVFQGTYKQLLERRTSIPQIQ